MKVLKCKYCNLKKLNVAKTIKYGVCCKECYNFMEKDKTLK